MHKRRLTPAYVAAGFPSPGTEWREPSLNVARLLGFVGEGSFCYPMKSSALSAAGIQRGDILVASPTLPAANRDLVIASLNGAVWVRRLLQASDIRFLVPEDLLYPHQTRLTVFPHEPLHIWGVILCNIRPLHPTARKRMTSFSRRRAIDELLGLDMPGIYCTRVQGNSMRAVGIEDGDVLIVDRSQQAEENDIVIAALDGHFIVKRLVQVRDAIFLLSDNPLMPPIAVTSQPFRVWGIVLFHLRLVHPLIIDRFLVQEQRAP